MRNGLLLSNNISAALLKMLPIRSSVISAPYPAKGFDQLLKIDFPSGEQVEFALEYTPRLDARDVPKIVEQFARESHRNTLLFSEYLSPSARRSLDHRSINYVDATGNAKVFVASPFVFISSIGLDQDPSPVPRKLRTLSGPTSARVVRFLCDNTPPYGIRELASKIDRNPGNVSRIIEFLSKDALIVKGSDASITSVDWRALIKRWAPDVKRRRMSHNYLEPRGINQFLTALNDADFRFALTGQVAAKRVAHMTPSVRAQCYVDDINMVAKKLGLIPAPTGSNVTLISAFDPVVYANSQIEGTLHYAAPSQVAADLLIGYSRDPEEADAYLDWMESHESTWRR